MSTERLIYSPSSEIKGTIDDIGIKISNQTIEALHPNEDSTGFFSLACLGGSSSDDEDWTKKSHIPFENIIWCQSVLVDDVDVDSLAAKHSNSTVELSYVYPTGKTIKPVKLIVELELPLLGSFGEFSTASDFILSKAYPNKLLQPSILVVINPHGGQGLAKTIYQEEIEPILKAAHVKIAYSETKYSGHATDLAKSLDVNKYDIIACCSGDGIPHEIINGFFQRSDRGLDAFNKLAITQLPCGSGNALSLSTHGSNEGAMAAFKMLKLTRSKLDLMAITQDINNEEVTKLSFLSQCYGMIADSDIGTEHLRWMGPIRFELGVFEKIMRRVKYPCDLYIKYETNTKQEISQHFEHHTSQPNVQPKPLSPQDFELKGPHINEAPPSDWVKIEDKIASKINVFYVGKMPYISTDTQFFPAALPNDGSMDLVITDTNSSILETINLLLIVGKGSHVHEDYVHHAKIKSYRLVPKLNHPEKHFISVDGESFPFQPFQVEVLPGILSILLQDGSFVDTCFTR